MNNRFKILLTVLLTALSFSSHAMGSRPERKEETSKKETAFPKKSLKANNMTFGRKGFSRIVKPLLPSVVNISTSKEIKAKDMQMPEIPEDSPLGDMFKHFFKEFAKRRRSHKSRSLGSGFIIDYDGKEKVAYIVTNFHIIKEADEIIVRLHEESVKELKAEVVGTDSRTDIALLKVKSKEKLVPIKWGSSEKAEVGEWSIAIGNPFGLKSTVTAGIISTKGRELPIADYVAGYLQTDAPINMGNSGGPLFNVDGEVIGINTAILAPNGGNIGIGFAIPSEVAKKVVKQLRELGHTRRGWLGAAVQHVTKEIAESVNLDEPKGALIAKIFDKSPAKKAGLERGDIILKFNDMAVKKSHDLPFIVGETKIGKEVEVIIWREGKRVKKMLTVGEFEKAEKAGLIKMKSSRGKKSEKADDAPDTEVMGMTLEELDDSIREKYRLESKATGVLITELDQDSEAAEKGLRPGDVIVEVGRKKVNKPAEVGQLFETSRKKKMKRVLLLINRRGELRFFTLSIVEGKKESKKEKKEKEGA